MPLVIRPWSDEDLPAAQRLARRLWPHATHHPGGLAWEAATGQLPTTTLVAER